MSEAGPLASAFALQALPKWKRAVLKVGSSVLSDASSGLSPRHVLGLAEWITECHAKRREVIIVSSGAVAAGRSRLHAVPHIEHAMALRQAYAALGQAQLINLWQNFFDRPVAQILLTHDDLHNRRRYLNARETLRTLLQCGVLPVINENDSVSIDELKFGDNDNLAAVVAALIGADAFFIATDIDGLFTANPRTDPTASPVHQVQSLTPAVFAMAKGSGSCLGTGGMYTKIEAAAKAWSAGIPTYLFNGQNRGVVRALVDDHLYGTAFQAPRAETIGSRKVWIRHLPYAQDACIRIDTGARDAILSRGASLLPCGIIEVSGHFQRGDKVIIYVDQIPFAHGIVQYSSQEMRQIAQHPSRQISDLLGYVYGPSVIHRDDLVVL